MKKTREEYLQMLKEGKFDLTEDQIALIAAASLLGAKLKHCTHWGILISLGLVQFYDVNPTFLVSTSEGDKILSQYSKLELFRMLKDYRAENGLDYLYHSAIYLIPLIPLKELPLLLVDENEGIRKTAAKQIYWHQHGEMPIDNH